MSEFIALYDYTGSTEGELTFKVGDILTVHEEVKEGWYSASLNGATGYAPSNYLQSHGAGGEEGGPKGGQDDAAKKARREKMMEDRRILRQTVEEKRAKRKIIEEEVKSLEEFNREKRGLIKKLANPTDDINHVIQDLISLAIELESTDALQSRYAELSTCLMMGLSSVSSLLNNDVKPGNPLEEMTKKFNDEAALTNKSFSEGKEKLDQLIRARKEFSPLLDEVRLALTNSQ